MFRFVQLVTAAALIAGVLQPPHASAQDTHLRVFAAASLKNALDDVIAKHKPELTSILSRHGVKLFIPKDPNTP